MMDSIVKPRDCVKVITQMLEFIPKEEEELIRQLEWNRNDASYKAPEETIQWERLAATLHSLISPQELNINSEEWKFEVYSLLSTISKDIIKQSLI